MKTVWQFHKKLFYIDLHTKVFIHETFERPQKANTLNCWLVTKHFELFNVSSICYARKLYWINSIENGFSTESFNNFNSFLEENEKEKLKKK